MTTKQKLNSTLFQTLIMHSNDVKAKNKCDVSVIKIITHNNIVLITIKWPDLQFYSIN